MPGVSSKTKVMMVRLPVSVAVLVEKRAEKLGVGVSEYLRRMIVLQVSRKHHG